MGGWRSGGWGAVARAGRKAPCELRIAHGAGVLPRDLPRHVGRDAHPRPRQLVQWRPNRSLLRHRLPGQPVRRRCLRDQAGRVVPAHVGRPCGAVGADREAPDRARPLRPVPRGVPHAARAAVRGGLRLAERPRRQAAAVAWYPNPSPSPSPNPNPNPDPDPDPNPDPNPNADPDPNPNPNPKQWR